MKEIIVFQETITLPGSGRLIEGIIHLQGEAIPVFNLRRKFGFPETVRTKDTKILVVEASETAVGLVADQVSEVMTIPDSLIQEPEENLTAGLDAVFVDGVVNIQGKLVIILDLDEMISRHFSKAI